MIPISTAVILGLLIAIHSETALAQTTLVPSSYVAEENYLYCNPAPNGDKHLADFRPDLDHEPDIYPGDAGPERRLGNAVAVADLHVSRHFVDRDLLVRRAEVEEQR
jgi:hypothetical protein